MKLPHAAEPKVSSQGGGYYSPVAGGAKGTPSHVSGSSGMGIPSVVEGRGAEGKSFSTRKWKVCVWRITRRTETGYIFLTPIRVWRKLLCTDLITRSTRPRQLVMTIIDKVGIEFWRVVQGR